MAVTPETIALALGRASNSITTEEDAQWSMWIDDALMLIGDRLTIGDLDEAKVDYVVREAVVAHIRHPDDATQVSVSIDDGSTSKTYKSSRGRVTILDEWWHLLSPEDDTGSAFTLDMLGSGSAHLPWCSYTLGANYCTCGVDIAGVPIYELGGWE